MGWAVGKLLRKLRGLKLAILAGLLTGGEALVAMGFELPGSSLIPIQYRGLAIFSLTVAAFVMRILAQRAEDRRGE